MRNNIQRIVDMNINDIVSDKAIKETILTFHSGESRKVFMVDEEVSYPNGRLIVSRTTPDGVITQANRAFIEMSGYESNELIGMPHAILRHPDVPSEIFSEMWEHILANKSWYGYVKNLRKDGKYYWVYASVNPTYEDGQLVAVTSVRRKPSREKVNEMMAMIKKMKTKL